MPPPCKNLYKICGKQIVLSHRLINAFDLHYIHTILSTVVVLSRNIKYLASSQQGFSCDKALSTLYDFVWFDSLRPINNLSVKQGRVFLGWTSTKLGQMCLAQWPQRSDACEARTRGPSVSSNFICSEKNQFITLINPLYSGNPEWKLLETVKTKMKCSIILHSWDCVSSGSTMFLR